CPCCVDSAACGIENAEDALSTERRLRANDESHRLAAGGVRPGRERQRAGWDGLLTDGGYRTAPRPREREIAARAGHGIDDQVIRSAGREDVAQGAVDLPTAWLLPGHARRREAVAGIHEIHIRKGRCGIR